ncbi:hypothetical protein JDV02_001943 [Purpureocillium takamizusanense]|uniref:DUF7702 domain-containing protein n=1 Tax=Purpureocillium takamizusanense TaxID=2060973 RepID=A0A9Q8V773_9HYPO|nr:uncharacterized protein JDV02_001943 [Purpureocillium takamizusanense]UNI15408.1 hypothetical protein JDV02_001943 [Purpureocillium takamizusanense]
MALGDRGYLSIAELIVYVPASVFAFTVCSRHGWHRASGWLYTLILCVVRITGAICQLVTYSDDSEGLLRATLIIDSIGLSPLLFATLGMLSRLVDNINSKGASPFSANHFRLAHILIMLALILSIVGGTSGSSSGSGQIEPAATAKAGIALYFVAFAGLTAILVLTYGYRTSVPVQERRIPLAVAIAWPFILARLVYSALATFVHNHLFSVVSGSVAVHAGMAVAEEFVVVVIYLVLGFSLRKMAGEGHEELASRPWKLRQGGRRRRD